MKFPPSTSITSTNITNITYKIRYNYENFSNAQLYYTIDLLTKLRILQQFFDFLLCRQPI